MERTDEIKARAKKLAAEAGSQDWAHYATEAIKQMHREAAAGQKRVPWGWVAAVLVGLAVAVLIYSVMMA